MWITMVPTRDSTLSYFMARLFQRQKWKELPLWVIISKALFSPVFLFLFVCMSLTAISEFGPQQWVNISPWQTSGANAMIILALTTGVMAVARFFAGPVVEKLGQTGVLLAGAILATIGIYLFSMVTGGIAYFVAIILLWE